MRIRTTILSSGKTATGMEIPDAVVEALGAGRRPPVRVTINGFTYRSSIAVMGGVFMLGVSNDVRRQAGVAAGDVVDVDIELDTEPREVEVPADLAAALDSAPDARAAFDRLPYSHKRRYVIVIDDAKAPETRARRIAKTVADLVRGRD